SLQGSRQNCGEPCRLLPADIPGCGFVVVTTRRLCTINTRPPFDHVEVYLQNALFAEDEFGHRYQRSLCALAEERATRSEEEVFTSCWVMVEAPRVRSPSKSSSAAICT